MLAECAATLSSSTSISLVEIWRPGDGHLDPHLDPAHLDPAHLDAVCGQIETERRAVSDAEQRSQVRAERGSLERMRHGDPRPVGFLRVVGSVPMPARALGRRSATAIAIPPPSPEILAAARR